MFDIGLWELLAVMTLGLLVLGPERLSQVVRTAGGWLGKARSMVRKMQYELEREVAIGEFERKTAAKPSTPSKEQAAAPAPEQPSAVDAPTGPDLIPDENTPPAADER